MPRGVKPKERSDGEEGEEVQRERDAVGVEVEVVGGGRVYFQRSVR